MKTALGIGFFLLTLLMLVPSCKKPFSFSNGNLNFSQDTVVFDTVFTTIGSTTKYFKIYNPDSKSLMVEEIELMGGTNSPFRINVDGVSGTKHTNLTLEGKDSLFIFVEVTLDANNALNPLIIEDSIRFRSNGKDQFVQLVVWGQDAYFHYRDTNSGTWANDKPHVVYGYAGIDSAQTLNIQAGTKIHLHKNSFIFVYKGTLNIDGSLGNEVTLQGDRLEQAYSDVSGQYYGIYFHKARPSTINYTNIINGTAGIHVDSEDPNNTGFTVEVTNTKISNCSSYGFFIFDGGKIHAENCVASKNGSHALFVLAGGDFRFNHCTLVGYGGGSSDTPAVGILNFYNDQQAGVQYVGPINEGKITNSVIYGTLDQEIAIETVNPNNIYTFGFDFRSNLIRYENIPSDDYFHASENFWNEEPLFIDEPNNNFYFWSASPLNNNANPVYQNTLAPAVGIGILGGSFPRSGTTPDIGAYERVG